MNIFFQYLVKLSISLALVYLFYQLVLRRLTFYHHNRWYLFGYSFLSFFMAFINISPVLEKSELADAGVIKWVPVISSNDSSVASSSYNFFTAWNIISLVFVTGMFIMLLRLLIQFGSFHRMMRKAELISGGKLKLYQVNDKIIPFSFGGSIFINRDLHTEAELQEIIRHEFVHVRQHHSLDIIWSEILCLLNWYNPFAWLLKRSIRQNLEFIADHKVLENGVSKKEYQYLLLKVIGNNQYSIATPFNFSSLKKRIAMMNKLRSAKVNLLRFLFVLPLLAVILVSFRKEIGDTLNRNKVPALRLPVTGFTDTVPEVTDLNSKGYFIDIKGKDGNCIVVIKDKNRKEVKQVQLTEWNEKKDHYTGLYGELPPPPPPLPPPPPSPEVEVVGAPLPPASSSGIREVIVPGAPLPPPVIELPKGVEKINVNNKKVKVILANGKEENYDLDKPAEKKRFENKYGRETLEIPAVPATIAGSPLASTEPVSAIGTKITATVTPATVTGMPVSSTAPALARSATGGLGTTVIAPMAADEAVIITDDYGYTITGKEDILVVINRKTTRQELEEHIKNMKKAGVDLSYDEIEYNSKGELVGISGTMRTADGRSNFVAKDFSTLVLSMIKKGEKTYFKVSTTDRKQVI